MIVIGLTGSIGMGKSTAAGFFREAGVPVHDSDATVADLYAGAAVGPIEAAFPGSIAGGRVDRAALWRAVSDRPEAFRRLEAIVHPLVRARQDAFLAAARGRGTHAVVLDIPLLFETGRARDLDLVTVVSAPAEVQRARVLARPGMTEAKFAEILARQVPDADKCRRAHVVLDSRRGLEPMRRAIADLLRMVALMA